MTTSIITREERVKAQGRAKRYIHFAVKGFPEIEWDDGSKTPAGDQQFEDSAQNSSGLLLAEHLIVYEAALTAAEEENARLREALRQIAEAHHIMIETDLIAIARTAEIDEALK